MKTIIQIKNLSFQLKQQEILSEINLTVQEGMIYGFLGPNGAGKTTLMKLMLNLLHTKTGEVEIFGQALTPKDQKYLASIGSIIETPVFYDKLTVYQNLELHCEYLGLYNKEKIDEKLKLVNLYTAKNKKAKELSLGMKQRLAIARALIAEPKLLILDEPINGLDPFGIKEIRELLLQINREQKTTIFISSHIMTEIESICDVIGFINHGKMVEELTITEIQAASKKYIEVKATPLNQTMQLLHETFATEDMTRIDDQTLRLYDGKISQGQIMQTLIGAGIEIHSIMEASGNLEDYFVKLMNAGEKHA